MLKVSHPKRTAYVEELLFVIILDFLITRNLTFELYFESSENINVSGVAMTLCALKMFEQVPDFLVRTTAVTTLMMSRTKSPT